MRKLAEFLEVDATEALISDIVEACAFNRMKKVDETKEQIRFLGMELGQKLYRKGKSNLILSHRMRKGSSWGWEWDRGVVCLKGTN